MEKTFPCSLLFFPFFSFLSLMEPEKLLEVSLNIIIVSVISLEVSLSAPDFTKLYPGKNSRLRCLISKT